MNTPIDTIKAEREEEARKKLEYNAQVARLKDVLTKHDIKLSFQDFGCGCCGGGVIKVEHKGEMILDNSEYSAIWENTDFSMFEGKE